MIIYFYLNDHLIFGVLVLLTAFTLYRLYRCCGFAKRLSGWGWWSGNKKPETYCVLPSGDTIYSSDYKSMDKKQKRLLKNDHNCKNAKKLKPKDASQTSPPPVKEKKSKKKATGLFW